MNQYIPIAISGLALAYSIYAGQHKETKEDTAALTAITVKLEMINDNVKEIKTETKNVRDELGLMREKLAITDQSVRSAHKRIDLIEGKETREDRK